MKKRSLFQMSKRLLKHLWFDASDTHSAVPPAMRSRLQASITASEAQHSGQIRLCVEAALPLSYIWRGLAARNRAVMLFGKLRGWDTQHNNGVLIYVLLAERKIEIVADRGLDIHVASHEWDTTVTAMRVAFQSKQYETGLAVAIQEVSDRLLAHFPSHTPNTNELPDTLVLQ
jgi:uncharacterized membrane protein